MAMGVVKDSWADGDAVDLSKDAIGGTGRIESIGRHFVDGYGRILQLRGMNVSGSSKLPTQPDGLKPLDARQFFAHESVSFVGRPFPLTEAPLHLARLRAWGHTLVRLLVTWESLAHAGPDPENDLDLEYIAYLKELLDLMSKYGIKVIICAHQDVWSRFSGGSGAPAWTFAKAGLDIEMFKATGAAYVAALDEDERSQKKKAREPVGAFVWPSGYQKLAAATMATLFWSGERFAWNLRVPSSSNSSTPNNVKATVGIQEYLQSSYIEAFGRLVDEVGGLDAVLGFDLMNEPHRGYVGMTDWHRWCYETDLHIGHFPSALQSFALGSGFKQDVPFYVKSWPFPTRRSHYSTLDPMGKSAWLKDTGMGECVWRAHGAWQWDDSKSQPVILSEDFFTRDQRPNGKKKRIEWYRDCYAPFLQRFADRLQRRHKHLFCFVEPIPNEFMPPWSDATHLTNLSDDDKIILMKASYDQVFATKTFIDTPRPEKFVYAPHFYDLNVLFAKIHGAMSVDVQSLSRGAFVLKALFFGQEGLKKNYKRQIATLVENGKASLGSVPIVIGEVGIPFDINMKHALRNGDYSKHIELLDALIEAMEQAQVGFTLWNYNLDNRTAIGDGWNSEDFSVMCYEKQALDLDNVLDVSGQEEEQHDGNFTTSSLYHGGRALAAILRPYAAKVAGYPLTTSWDRDQAIFRFEYVNLPVEIRQRVMRAAQMNPDQHEDESRTTKIHLPRFYFDATDVQIHISDGEFRLDVQRQTLSVRHSNVTPGFTHWIRVSIGKAPRDAAKLSAEQREIVARRLAVRARHHRLIRLTASDYCAILGLLVALSITLALSQLAAQILTNSSNASSSAR